MAYRIGEKNSTESKTKSKNSCIMPKRVGSSRGFKIKINQSATKMVFITY